MQGFRAAPPSEYLPQEDERHTDSPGSDASRRAWETAKARAVADFKKSPYDLREQVCLCNDAELTDFSKLLFCRLTDMAFKDAFKRGDGVIACSKKFLADDFDCSVDTVTRATRVLERSGFLWTKTVWNGSFEITWWFIREWADDKKEYDNHSGSNFGRRVRKIQRNTIRGERGKFAPNPDSIRSKIRALLAANGHVNGNGATVKAEISPDHGSKSALTTPTNQPGQGANVSLDHGQKSALTGPENQPGQGAHASPDTAEISALTRQKNQPCQTAPVPGSVPLKTSIGDKEEEKGGTRPRESTLEKQLGEWRQSLNGSFPSRLEKMRTRLEQQRKTMRKGAARDFLDRKLAILGELLDGPLPPDEPAASPPFVAPKQPPAQPKAKINSLVSAMRAAAEL